MSKESCVQVSLEPIVRMKWPDGREVTFSADDITQFLTTLVIEELLLVQQDGKGNISAGLQLDLFRDDEGRWILRAADWSPVRLPSL